MNVELHYPGKRPKEAVLAYASSGKFCGDTPFDPTADHSLLLGDNFPILSSLRTSHTGAVDLVYIDPPFGTGRVFPNGSAEIAYQDQRVDQEFLEFLRVRLILMRELLSDRGSLYLHIDKKAGHYVKIILDEVFGRENFLNDITRIKCNPKNFARKAFGNSTDMILLYAKQRDKHIWQEQREPLTPGQIQRLFPKHDPEKGPYTTHPLHAPGETHNGDTGQSWRGLRPPKGRHWRYKRDVLDELDAQGLIEWSPTGNPRKRFFAREHKGQKLQDFWEFKDKGASLVSYPTQKNTALLKRIISQSSHPDSLVLDAFAGSGSTLIAAQQLGRRFIGIDQSETAAQTILKNFTQHQVEASVWTYREGG